MKADRSEPSRLPWDRITAIASMVIAVLALGSSAYQAKLNRDLTASIAETQRGFQEHEAEASRQHRVLSVTPKLFHNFDLAQQVEEPGLYLENRGLGPATIHDISVFEAGEWVGRCDSEDSMQKILERFDIQGGDVQWQAVFGSYGLLPGSEFPIFVTTEAAYRNDDWRRRFAEGIKRMQLGYCYCSAYGECWQHTSWGAPRPAVNDCLGVDYRP